MMSPSVKRATPAIPSLAVKDSQPFHGVQLLAVGAHMAEPGGHVRRHPVEEDPGHLNALAVDGQGDVPFLDHAVGGIRYFVHQHGVVLCPVAVQVIPGNEDLLLKVLAVEPLVVDGDLGGGAGVQGVPLLYSVQMLTVFHGWYQAHTALADGILFALAGLVALSWVVTLARKAAGVLREFLENMPAAKLLADRVRQTRLARESIVSTNGL